MRTTLLLAVSLLALTARADEGAGDEYPERSTGLFFRVHALVLTPVSNSTEVSLENVDGPAQLAVKNGPIAGSSVGLGTNVMPSVTIGWSLPFLERRLALETVLALPFKLKMYARGSLADQSLAPTVLGNLPTGVPPLGSELGEVTVAPPLLTLTYRFGPIWRVRPYLGLGISYLINLDARITNPVLTEVVTPTIEVPNALGFVMQGGFDVHLFKWFFATFDFKYIAGLDLEAKVKNVWVRLPNLPLYGAAHVGDNVVKVTVNPLVFQLGVGVDL
jgi:outer membrane protein W